MLFVLQSSSAQKPKQFKTQYHFSVQRRHSAWHLAVQCNYSLCI